ncbi:M2 family metallopeptidase [Shewanella profunda]|uniref:M3 family metallopeptidase n=1 Tax=Shewanella profunda TaxID=254793 RepID=UPI00200DB1FA|nr:M3 family metallopeptidase [Shewanella profunda]MCL1088878.1 M2 family metallopeptidase [Shewanella profunda]
MVKLTLLTLGLLSSGFIYAAPSPVPLLVEQCLRLPRIDLAVAFTEEKPPLTIAQQALILEQQTIGLNNINDRVNYYRGFKLSADEREGLLQCQLRLADTLSELVNQTEFHQLTNALTQGNREQMLLSGKLQSLIDTQLSITEKAKLHTAQATISQGLASQQFSLDIHDAKCELITENQTDAMLALHEEDAVDTQQRHFSGTVASYLLKQENPQCRQQVWQAYQGRASQRNRDALSQIAKLRQQTARAAGFPDHASFSLSTQLLSSPALVKAFLDTQTHAVEIAPWDLGQILPQKAFAQGPELQTAHTLTQSFAYLQQWGLNFEPIETINIQEPSHQIFRVYHQRRLLGELYISYNVARQSHQQQTLRQSVIGQQFGQQALELKPQLSTHKDIEQFTHALAQAVTSLAKGSHFYLNNTQDSSQDSHHIASLWLTEMLRSELFPHYEQTYLNEREILIKAYTKQLKVFRAKVALSFYQAQPQQSYGDLATEFTYSFGQEWSQVNDYQYSFNAIANEGPLYYQSLWQEALAKFIYQITANRSDKLNLFNLLVVNEDSLSLSDQLSAFIDGPTDPTHLIQYIADMARQAPHLAQ